MRNTSYEIEHIVWETSYDYTAEVIRGLLEIRVYWHGGGTDTFIAEGSFYKEGKFAHRVLGTIDEATPGVSGVALIRVGNIV
jgi:hypothetical protein